MPLQDEFVQASREGNVNVQRCDQRCGNVGQMKAPLLLLSVSLREMPDEHTYSKALIAASIAASQENIPNVQNDRLGKLMLNVRSFAMVLGLALTDTKRDLSYPKSEPWRGSAECQGFACMAELKGNTDIGRGSKYERDEALQCLSLQWTVKGEYSYADTNGLFSNTAQESTFNFPALNFV